MELTKIIRVPREKVIDYFSKPELYLATHSKHKSFKVVSKEENVVFVDEEWEFEGRRLNFTHKIVLNLPDSIGLDIVKGQGKGSKETIIFAEVAEGTNVTYISDFKLGRIAGKIFGWLASKQIKDMLEEMAEKDRRFLEGEKRVLADVSL